MGGVAGSLAVATAGNPPPTPYVIARPATAAAFLFISPLHPKGTKVTWVVRGPRSTPLVVEARPLGGGASQLFPMAFEPDPGPAQTYTGTVAVGGPGCWQFTMSWADQVAQMELSFTGP